MNTGKLIILAGGVSSRMKKPVKTDLTLDEKILKETEQKTKSMLSVGKNSRPFMDYLLYNARESGYREIIIVISEQDESIKNYYGAKNTENEFLGLNISYVVQKIPKGREKPLGTADALLQALQFKNEWKGTKFTVCNSDNLYSQKAFKLLFENEYPNSLIDYDRNALEFEESKILKFAIIGKDEDNFLTGIIEKPTNRDIEKAKNGNGKIGVSMNIFSFQYNDILPYLESIPIHPKRDEKELPVAVNMMVKDKPKCLYCYQLAEHVVDLTAKEDILKVKKYLDDNFEHINF
ncbi:MAG TPA: sugar phosphate nucleotidyltransferase [Ignavibacteriaceae bacterium]|nr:sugar phosphate nucleotidyltransferase [Ignavibacteriaceae bacterium]